jgi:hypothetical protein
MMNRLACLSLTLLLVTAACGPRRPTATAPAPPAAPRSYIDLAPGWRLSVITPILRSGKFLLEPARVSQPVAGGERSLNLTVEAGPDFLGYERSYYAVEPWRKGVRVRFQNAERVIDGKSTPSAQPLVKLFESPPEIRHLRLIFLIRGSQADHNMALVGAATLEALDPLTRQVQSDPTSACRSQRGEFCAWVPAGIAVRPEVRRGGPDEWIPAQ